MAQSEGDKRGRQQPSSTHRRIQIGPGWRDNTSVYVSKPRSSKFKKVNRPSEDILCDTSHVETEKQEKTFCHNNRPPPSWFVNEQPGKSTSTEVNGCRPKVRPTYPQYGGSNSIKRTNGRDSRTSRDDSNVRTLVKTNHSLTRSTQEEKRNPDAKKITIGFPFLKSLLGHDPSYIVMELTKRKPLLIECIARTATEHDFLEIFLSVVARAYLSNTTPKQIIGLFETLKEEKFFDSVVLYLIDLSTKIDENNVDVAKVEQTLMSLLGILTAQLQRNPSSWYVFKRTHTMVNQVAENLRKNGSLKDDICNGVRELGELRKFTESSAQTNKSVSQKPPDDFRRYPVSPSKDELLYTGRPFLRPNKVDGQYDDLDNYLDVQFRLLREDFVGPLREGLIEFIDSKTIKKDQMEKMRKKNMDIKIFENVTILCPVLTVNGIGYKLQLARESRRINWKQSKRLIFGSLVCLTDVDLSDFYIATVVDRDEIHLGFLTVNFVEVPKCASDVLEKKFHMAESSGYYESYKHILAGLQNVEENDIPFKDYILGRNISVAHPSYLEMSTEYDLRPLVDTNYIVQSESRLKDVGVIVPATFSGHFSMKSRPAKAVKVRKLDSWPSKDLLNLDDSQYKAVQTALTKEFAIVQGPPGTGKTHIGLQIAKTLLHNKKIWAGSGNYINPMLVVCYTNHALDQFMEGIVKCFNGDVIRVGGRSQSKLLLSLKEIRKSRHDAKTAVGIMQRNRLQAREDLNKNLNAMKEITRTIELYRSEVIHERALKTIMGKHYNSLIDGFSAKKNKYRGSSFSYLFRWLGITEIIRRCSQDAVQEVSNKRGKYIIQDDALGVQLRRAVVDAFEDIDYGLNDTKLREIRSGSIAFHADANKPQTYPSIEDEAIDKLYRGFLRSELSMMILDPDVMTDDEVCKTTKLWHLDKVTRWRLYRHWVRKLCINEYDKIENFRAEFEEVSERYQEALRQEDKEIMRHAAVIGMTTSAAARYQATLNDIGPSIVIVEEAAEVLESHIVMSLSRLCRHLILIGDHKQLRPNPNVYILAKKYNLDISLFERMIKLGMDYSSLNLQHRMRPQISTISRHIYPDLQDHESVEAYANVKGVANNVMLINHEFSEAREADAKSYSNPHEAKYAIELCRYLIKQGYKTHQITILTTYIAQLFYIKNAMTKTGSEEVKVTVVDNYQGEENDIIILSLVRSNKDGKIGFLKTENRVCVALSRAKIGFYVLGNFNLLSVQSSLWERITDSMRDQGCLSDRLKLYCQNHPNNKGIEAMNPSDFAKAPEGGCMLICDVRLDCGHKCEKHCHILDPKHSEYRCMKKCQKRCEAAGHPCKALCHMDCPPCPVIVTKVVPSCLHKQDMTCSTNPSKFSCLMPCVSTLECGHPCTKRCGQSHTARCLIPVEKGWPCGHKSRIKCFETKTLLCPEPCHAILKCEHRCKGTCGSCWNGRVHEPCSVKCSRTLVCGHQCDSFCNMCVPCKKPCRNRCVHSRCQHVCGEACKPCTEPCAWICKHYACKKLCHEVCDRPKCDRRCYKKIKCGHDCIGLCGEPCPKLCRICHKNVVTEIFFGDEDNPGARFVLLEDCNHIIEVEAMDTYMSTLDDAIKMKCCPKCSTPIQKSRRYGTVINEILTNIERVKREMIGDTEDLIKSIQKDTEDLIKSIQKPVVGRLTFGRRASSVGHLRRINDRCRGYFLSRLLDRILSSKPVFKQLLVTFQNQGKMADALNHSLMEMKSMATLMPIDENHFLQETMMKIVSTETDCLTEQQIEDISLELKRRQRFVTFAKVYKELKKTKKNEEASGCIENIKRILLSYERFDDEKQTTVSDVMSQLKEMTKVEGLSITEEERLDIVKAVGLKTGHWFKCPNNHIYAIGECGGANEKGVCPECKAAIGGISHRLADGNSVAKEMDGAKFAAYSEEANNLGNFDLNNLF